MLGNVLKQKRAEANLTQEELGQMLSVKQSEIARWESGRTTPNIVNLNKLCRALNTTIDILLNVSELQDNIVAHVNQTTDVAILKQIWSLLD